MSILIFPCGGQSKNKGDKAAKKVEEGEMPPWFYLIPNSSARLSENEKIEFTEGLRATFGEGDGKNEHAEVKY